MAKVWNYGKEYSYIIFTETYEGILLFLLYSLEYDRGMEI